MGKINKPIVAITAGSGYTEISRIMANGGAGVILIHNRGDMNKIRNATHLLLSGGADIHPSYYGQETSYARGFDVKRDWLELRLARYAINRGMPTLGICRGMQMLAVADGGALWQDFAIQTESNVHTAQHEIRTARNSWLREVLTERCVVNSYHHQAVSAAALPKSWKATAWTISEHEIIEGMEHRSKPLVGVQFHPEFLSGNDRAGEYLLYSWLDGDVPAASSPAKAKTLPLFA